jgi:hypothetical protein
MSHEHYYAKKAIPAIYPCRCHEEAGVEDEAVMAGGVRGFYLYNSQLVCNSME